MRRCRRVLELGLAGALLVPASAPAQTQVSAGKTTDAELVKTIPVTRPDKVRKTVVMRLEPGQIPDLRSGDVLKAAAELQVTTRCDVTQRGRPGCGYEQTVHAQLILADQPQDESERAGGPVALSRVKDPKCTVTEHHCLITFGLDDAERPLGKPDDPPCVARDHCYVNLVAWATHRRASSNDELIIGQNTGNYLRTGRSHGDNGRLMVVRRRGPAAKPDRRDEGDLPVGVPTNKERKRVASFSLGPLRRGERYAIEVDVRATGQGRPRFSTKLFLTKNRGSDDGNGVGATDPRAISEHNGINCLGSCEVRRVAVFAVTEDERGPVFLNVQARGGDPGRTGATLKVTKVTARIVRWDPPGAAVKDPGDVTEEEEEESPPGPDPAPRPPGAGREEPSALTCRSARLNGWVNPHGSPTRFHFEYWKRGSGPTMRTGGGDAGAGTERVDVSRVAEGLERDTHYSGRLIATSAGGETASEVFSFTTRARC